jgi:hypothetical protein
MNYDYIESLFISSKTREKISKEKLINEIAPRNYLELF